MATPVAASGPSPEETAYFMEQVHAHLSRSSSEVASPELDRLLHASPPGHRAQYAKLLAQARGAYHASVAHSRREALNASIASTLPNGSLKAEEATSLSSPAARSARARLFGAFAAQHTRAGLVGVQPFFSALRSVLDLQARGELAGGGGAVCLEWKLDDAVLMESGGDAFAAEAVGALKGVLGFLDQPFTAPADSTTEALRTWRLPPHLPDPELRALARLVPARFARRARFSITSPRGEADLEQGEAEEEVKLATGTLRRSLEPREEGYKGSVLERLVGWLWGFVA